ncbi:hypothetical protein F5Y14DRAFT_447002 [Nemania sp. NC0429]|nr:hypothetical protein F5Y14DRAFT_447002 [Nemania sp. NC0429]
MPYLCHESVGPETHEVGSSEITGVGSSEATGVGSSEIAKVESSEMAPPLHVREGMALFGPPKRLPIAQTIRIINERIWDPRSAPFRFPVKQIELFGCDWSLRPDMPVPICEATRTVHLLGTNINWDGFRDLLTCFPCMDTLVYSRPADEIDTHFDMVGEALTNDGANLEHLTMLNENYMPFCTPVGSLHTLTNLRSLEIHLELLIGFRENPIGYDEYMDWDMFEPDNAPDYEEIIRYAGDWSLIPLLPASLEKLILHVDDPKLDVYFNTYERYGAKIEELLMAEHLFERLTDISAPGLTAVEKRIRSRHTGWILTAQSAMQRPPTEAKVEDYEGDCDEFSEEDSMECCEDDVSAPADTVKSEEQPDL